MKSASLYSVQNDYIGKIDNINLLDYKGNEPEKLELELDKVGNIRMYLYMDGYCVTKEYTKDIYISKTNKEACNWYGTDNYEKVTGDIITFDTKDIITYKIYGNSYEKRIPDEYQEVEFVKSFYGVDYFDTGIIPNENIGFDIVFEAENTNSIIFGSKDSDTSQFQLTTNNNTLKFGSKSYEFDIKPNQITHITLKNKILTDNDGNKYSIDGQFTSTSSLVLFALNDSGTITNMSKIKLYSLKLYDGDNLIRDYIPCYTNDYGIGLYDLVTQTYYHNSGEILGLGKEGIYNQSLLQATKIKSLGSVVNNTSDINYGKYKIDIVINGKNLVSAKEIYKSENDYTEIIEDTRNCIRFVDSRTVFTSKYKFKENTQYTITLDSKVIKKTEGNTGGSLLINFFILMVQDQV